MHPVPPLSAAPALGDLAIANQIAGSIPRVHRPSVEDLERDYVATNRPVIITGMMDDWRALQRWTPAFFAQLLGDLDIHANIQDLDDKLILGRVGAFEAMKLRRLVELIESQGEPRRAYYLRAYPVHKLLDRWPELADDFRFPDLVNNWADPKQRAVALYPAHGPLRGAALGFIRRLFNRGAGRPVTAAERTRRVSAVLFLGGKGTITPLHSDGMMSSAYLCQVYGRKRCFMISPEQDDAVYPRPFRKQFGMSLVDYRKPDFSVHPKFRSAKLLEGVIGPGDMLFTPGGWWHAVQSLDASISYSHQVVNEANGLGLFAALPERQVARVYYLLRGGLRNVTGAKDWDE